MSLRNEKHEFSFKDIPNIDWLEFESLIVKAGGSNRESLYTVVVKLSAEAGSGIVPSGLEYQYISEVVSKIRKKVTERKYQVLMNCLAVLCNYGELSKEDLNEFLEKSGIMYRAVSYGLPGGITWEMVDEEDYEFDTGIGHYEMTNSMENDTIKRKELGIKMDNKGLKKDKPTKIFITHSSKDEEYVLVLTELLRNIKIPNKSIICTSDPRHRIPNGENAYKWLREQFVSSNLHMIFVLSENYYNSKPCLNEMGAAWLTAKKSDILLLPGFGISDFKKQDGCLSSDIQAGNIDSDDKKMKAWLNNLRDDVINEFEIERPDELDWENYRDSFIKKMREIIPNKAKALHNKVEDGDDYDFGDEDLNSAHSYNPVVGMENVDKIPVDSALLLVYAAEDNGQIIRLQTLGSPVQVSAAGRQFMADMSPRESARWVEALDRLVKWGWIRPTGSKNEIFEVTNTGYNQADWLKDRMEINTEREPLEELKKYEY